MGILNKAPNPKEEALYQRVFEELEEGIKFKGLWAKAYAKSNGDIDRVESIYIDLRVDSLRNEDKYEAQRIAYKNKQAKIEEKERKEERNELKRAAKKIKNKIRNKKRLKFIFWLLVLFILFQSYRFGIWHSLFTS
ncbi:uncharacterized protein METZ01_LOCUS487164 [marine metagenome]|uniref:Uncharacterized protein n=1 Tax=marine metagenome TaxID=408172 RepID=A0A383CQL5_9ZZZZ